MTTAWCPNCKKVVMTSRNDIDVGLAIFLFCCTGGIGLVIYLIIYALQPEDRCVFCRSITEPLTNQVNRGYPSSQPSQPINRPSGSVPGPSPYPQTSYAHQTAGPTVSGSQKQFAGQKVFESPVQGFNEHTGEPFGTSVNRFCPVCGEPFKVGQKYCQSCGSDLTEIK